MELEKDYEEMINNEEVELVFSVRMGERYDDAHYIVLFYKNEEEFVIEYYAVDYMSSYSYTTSKEEAIELFLESITAAFDYISHFDCDYEQQELIRRYYAECIFDGLDNVKYFHKEYADLIEKYEDKLLGYIKEYYPKETE
ncbi:hypothetical protein NDK47_23885 [Brevibacillus ruminantium]|uniref:DUF4375 domain-containing protein n=1 Tax=Brevibacillus ruminantium TaxID=2950604 RepID=A0ABY4WD71_9BACL|nr:hypothetical protein [Brevibacillus ruminantium]USG65127.1 hypothetical protein NDK47_23885 [Brevibacillus ruminantium]